MLRHYYPSLTLAEFAEWTLWTLEDSLETLKDILFRSNYGGFYLAQTVINSFKGKDGVPVELDDLLPDFANPFKKAEPVRLYDKRSARAFQEGIKLGLIPDSVLSLISLELLAQSAGEAKS